MSGREHLRLGYMETEVAGLPELKCAFTPGSKTLDILLHGLKVGMDSSLISKVFDRSIAEGNSIVAFNFPYFSRNEKNTSGADLHEELEAVRQVLKFSRSSEFSEIRLIGKSLGGIVAGEFLKTLSESEQKRFKVVVLGYDTGDIDLSTFTGEITVVQGSEDDHGTYAQVMTDLSTSKASKVNYVNIQGGDHSYRDTADKTLSHEDEAVEAVFNLPF